LNLLLGGVPSDTIHLGKECTAVSPGDHRATAAFADGSSIRARVLVGSDGIESKVRTLLSDDELKFAELVVLRGIAPASKLPTGVANDRITM
jgi:salicylate hydroxylase